MMRYCTLLVRLDMSPLSQLRNTNKTFQASVIYVLDMEGMKFDPTLLSIVTGPYRILWASVYTNYPEWIDKMLIINAPSFMSLVWKVRDCV